MFPEAARVFFHTSKYFVTWIPYSVACTLVNFSFHPPSAHSAGSTIALSLHMNADFVWSTHTEKLSIENRIGEKNQKESSKRKKK